ncbi:hypothetical protein BB778_04720 [Pluralibacter gergoviae]|uniref:hypothetical protein n=1 Tax=Pluralibacter gergoviae TaxID=61647 RepID=UPI0008DC1776|nr:hypothetical protein [Pluralibacter gergoviae]OHY61897.1 hypothetical protein BB778_04720 [Pluralibacter gergoviae]
MTPYETTSFLTAVMVSGICPFILSAYSGGSRRVILLVIAGPLAALSYRWLDGAIPAEALALSLCAGLVLLTAALFRIHRGERPVA